MFAPEPFQETPQTTGERPAPTDGFPAHRPATLIFATRRSRRIHSAR